MTSDLRWLSWPGSLGVLVFPDSSWPLPLCCLSSSMYQRIASVDGFSTSAHNTPSRDVQIHHSGSCDLFLRDSYMRMWGYRRLVACFDFGDADGSVSVFHAHNRFSALGPRRSVLVR